MSSTNACTPPSVATFTNPTRAPATRAVTQHRLAASTAADGGRASSGQEASNKAPDTVTASHCYELNGPPVDGDPAHAFVFFKVEDPATISVAFASGEYCPTVLPAGARKYKR